MSEAVAPAPATGGSGFFIGIALPLLLAVVVHGVAVLALVEGWSVADDAREAARIEAIYARLIQLEAQAPEAPVAPAEVVERPAARPEQPVTPPRDSTPASREQPASAERTSSPDATEAPTPPAETPQSTRQSDFEDDALRDVLGDSLDDAIRDETDILNRDRTNEAVASYVGAIVSRIQRNWSRPASARNGMLAELIIGLVPTGEVVSVEVVVSSGNAAFDRSAQVAVRDAAPFDVPQDSLLFEREFRNLRILFRPEDLDN